MKKTIYEVAISDLRDMLVDNIFGKKTRVEVKDWLQKVEKEYAWVLDS